MSSFTTSDTPDMTGKTAIVTGANGGIGRSVTRDLAAALARDALRGRVIALAALGFAILGVIAGLGFTVRGGDVIDVAYHATLLPVLLITLAAVSKRLPLHPHPPTAPGRA
jgi:NAD(P)-dependent dehydrogenase (short-subunit alcohol dehydrogenase family)